MISLGCAKNLVDSEHILGLLKSKGFDFARNLDEAGVVIINTCGFIRSAVEETIETILEVVDLKMQGKLKRVVVAGCFVQRYGYKLQREIPDVDGWLGTGELFRIVDIFKEGFDSPHVPFYINRPVFLEDHTVPKIQLTPFHSTYLKIAEGCSHRCSFCIIPKLRGPFRSRSLESLLLETEAMAEQGVKEINLIAQDTTVYGNDLEEDVCLEDLLERLIRIKGIRWIRLLYCHPGRISDRLLELIESEEVICPYLDLPFQHINERLLMAMGRNTGSETPWELIERIRSRRRRISLRTTLMVGFPGETEDIFNDLYDFVKTAEFDHLGTFVFSREEGAYAARLKSTVTGEAARRRQDRLMILQRDISKKLNQRLEGHTVPVLVEGASPETDLLLKGRTATMAPDVDGQVLINKGEGLAGEIMPVLITKAHAYDLIGEIR